MYIEDKMPAWSEGVFYMEVPLYHIVLYLIMINHKSIFDN